MSAFPALTAKADSAKYSRTAEDPAIRSELEGGYVYSRPRFTRTPRKSWKIGYTEMNNTDRATLEAFWDTVRGGSDSFTWTDPQTNTGYTVRFKSPIEFKYTGFGGVHFWNVSFELEQV